jgi:hypothetical protein
VQFRNSPGGPACSSFRSLHSKSVGRHAGLVARGRVLSPQAGLRPRIKRPTYLPRRRQVAGGHRGWQSVWKPGARRRIATDTIAAAAAGSGSSSTSPRSFRTSPLGNTLTLRVPSSPLGQNSTGSTAWSSQDGRVLGRAAGVSHFPQPGWVGTTENLPGDAQRLARRSRRRDSRSALASPTSVDHGAWTGAH